ncbi:MAG: hypothetical protein QM813_20275 [Verrucomicrobiota bacterium]
MKTKISLLLACVASALLAGCDSKPSGNSSGGAGTATAPVKPARQTSFAAVTSQLDPGGTVYGYLSTDQWLAGLSTNILEWQEMIVGLPDVSAQDAKNIGLVFDFLAKGVAKSGIENLDGVGLSAVQITPELFRTKLVLHHGAGPLWDLFGTQPHPLTGLDLLPTNTAIASFGDMNLAALWSVVERSLSGAGVPELRDGLEKWPAEFERHTQIAWADLLGSLGNEAGFVLTLDAAHRISVPLDKQSLEFPAPGLMLVLKVNNDLLFDRLSQELKKSEQTKFTDADGLRMYVMPLMIPLPAELQITLARAGEYLFVATAPTLVQEALAVRAGKTPGFKQSAGFQALQKFAPTNGNSFSYVDRRFTQTITEVQKQIFTANAKLPPAQAEFFDKLVWSRPPVFGFSVGSHQPTGWQSVSVGNQDSSASLVAAPVAGVAVGAAMILPALAKAKEKAQSISCQNNMKQISLGFHLWAADHGDKFPFLVSKAQGGTLELCERDGEGYDRNAAQHFQALARELANPVVFVCPGDKSKQAASDTASLDSWNVSYQLRTGSEVRTANPEEVLLYCPIHHHTGRTDGSIRQGKKSNSNGI